MRTDVHQVDQWVEQGIAVIQLPGKCVLTRKSGTGRRRCRAVCCGNYLPPEKLGLSKEDLYASGAEGVTLRIALAYAARYVEWRGFTIDVKSAFLYAPIGAEAKGREERIVVKPPSFLTELGILKSTDRWWVKKALYGLPTSPKDWGNYRDQEFRLLTLYRDELAYVLVQSKADESLWFIRENVGAEYGEVVGLLVVYVDDLAVFSKVAICNAFIKAVQDKWKTSPPTWFGLEPVTFCGVEIVLTERGYRLAQSAYLQELLLRFGIEGTSSMPLTKWVEPEIPSAVNVEDVRAAQAITGALLWIATRSRPDISFSVSKMGQMATKAPKITSEIGRQVLAYLNSTATLGIEFLFKAGAFFSEHGNLSLPRTDGTIEIYSDASHSPGGDRSTQCVIILWRGSPIVWESSRQPFTTLSSAESELVGMVHSVQLAESLQSLIDELLSVDSTMSLMGDNAAAVRAFDNAGGGWRNRHLRMRAVSGRERILAGVLKVSHLPGEYQIADLGTKPLSRVRIFQLLELMNIRSHVDPTEVVRTARMLSRLSLAGIASVPLTAEALAGLALLAAVPRVTAQPSRAEVGPGSNFYGWVAVVCLGLFLVWCVRLFRGVDPEEIKASPGDTAGLLEEDQPDSTDHQLRDADCASGGDAHGSSSSEDFHTDEWVRAEEKLVAAERRTGLTFIQRARLRRQLLAGEVVDVPVFQQRYGGLPSWLTGGESENVPSVLYSRPSPQVATVAGLFSSCGGTLLALLSSSAVEWGRLRVSCRGLHRNAVLTLVGQARNTRAVVGRPQGENFRAEPGIEPVGARLQEYPEVAQTVVGSSDMGQASDVSPAQLPGFNAPVVRVTTSEDKVTSLKENLEGLSQVAQGSNLGFLRMSQSGHAVSAGPDVGLAGSKEGALEIHGSSEGEDEALEIQGSSDVEDEALVGGSVVASVSQRAERVPQLGSREGSTGSVSNFQQGGSSGSHGMQAAQLSGCYEDYCGEATLVDRFPYVGSWLQVHFLIHLFSQVGEQILWALGERSQDWLTLRSISGGVKCAMSLAVVEVMRRGPHAILFNSPQ